MTIFIQFIVLCLIHSALSFPTLLQAQGETRVIQIHARRFSFTPAEIELTRGEPVTLQFTADDATHGLKIPELGVDIESNKGKATSIELTPQQTGTFEGRCSHFCGVGHGSMIFSVTVKEK